MAGFHFPKLAVFPATLCCMGAARCKSAARLRVNRAGNFARQSDAFLIAPGQVNGGYG